MGEAFHIAKAEQSVILFDDRLTLCEWHCSWGAVIVKLVTDTPADRLGLRFCKVSERQANPYKSEEENDESHG